MTTALDADDYISTIWFMPGRGQDYMATLFKKAGESEFTLEYRFRYYNEESTDPFDGKDVKHVYVTRIPDAVTENECINKITMLSKGMEAAGYGGALEILDIRGDAEAMKNALIDAPWAHMKFLRKEVKR